MKPDWNGEDSERSLNTAQQVEEAVEELCRGAARRLLIRAPRLDFAFLRSTELAGALAPLITGDRRNHIRILIDDEQHFLRSDARVVDLTRKFNSYVEVRKLPPDYSETDEVFVIADRDDFLYMKAMDTFPARLAKHSPGPVRQLERHFKHLWERSEGVAELFTLGL